MTISRILAADIGGTNCRLALFELVQDELRLHRTAWSLTRELHDVDDVIRVCDASDLGARTREVDAFVLAVAGPVLDPLHGETTNAGLRLDLRDIAVHHGIQRAKVINDFTAQAYACLTPAVEGALRVAASTGASAPPGTTRGVIGGGTGLGGAALVRDTTGNWLAVPTEVGHTAFPFVGREEEAFHGFIRAERGYPYARGDDVLTGTGLTLLHRFLTDQKLRAEEVSDQALREDTETRRWFARFYGRACRNWILTTLCRGGLYVVGGIAAKNPGVLACPEFERELYTSPHYASLLKSVPIWLNTDENSGLWGAAQVGADMLKLSAH